MTKRTTRKLVAKLRAKPKPRTRKAGQRPAAKPERDLNARERQFVLEYLARNLNGKQAAIAAGYSERTADVTASKLLRRSKVAAAVAEAQIERANRTRVDADWLLRRLQEEAEADIADLYDDAGHLKPVKDWPKIWRQGLVAGLDVEQLFAGEGDQRAQVGIVTKIKHADRARRLELIGRHIGVQAFKDRKEVSADEPLKELLRQISGRSIRPKT